MGEWQAGDVAMVRLDPETEIRVMYNGACWLGRKGAFYDLHASARPLVVIDPEDREQVERLVKACPSDWGFEQDAEMLRECTSEVQTALRSLIEPPKCSAALIIKAAHFGCDQPEGHVGLAHSNADAEAIWGDSE